MKKYAIFALILIAAYGVAMALMWSRYETQDKYIEFPSDFRDKLVELVPSMTFSQLSPETFHAAETVLMTVDVPDPKRFLALESYSPNGRGETPYISISVEIEKNARDKSTGILVTYGSSLYFTNATDDDTYIDSILLRHADRYPWPGQSDNWTAISLSYTGGDFHFDNKSKLWFWTWISACFAFLLFLIITLQNRDPRSRLRGS